jgi:hypothetical protein
VRREVPDQRYGGYRWETVQVSQEYYSPRDGLIYMAWGMVSLIICLGWGLWYSVKKSSKATVSFFKSDNFNQSKTVNKIFGLK